VKKMADEVEKKAASEAPATPEKPGKVKKKSLRPTNCTQSNKRIRRKDWYYRNGKYFASKQCYKLYAADEAKKKSKAADEAKAKEAAPAAAGEKSPA